MNGIRERDSYKNFFLWTQLGTTDLISMAILERDVEPKAETKPMKLKRRLVAEPHLAPPPSLASPSSFRPDPAYQTWDPEEFDASKLDTKSRLPRKRLASLVKKEKLEPLPLRRVRSERIARLVSEDIANNATSSTSPTVCRDSGACKIFRPDKEAKVVAFAEASQSVGSFPMPAFAVASGGLWGAPLRSGISDLRGAPSRSDISVRRGVPLLRSGVSDLMATGASISTDDSEWQ